jgi:hypothetical protein
VTKAQERTLERYLAETNSVGTPLNRAIGAALEEVRDLRQLCGEAWEIMACGTLEESPTMRRLRKAAKTKGGE